MLPLQRGLNEKGLRAGTRGAVKFALMARPWNGRSRRWRRRKFFNDLIGRDDRIDKGTRRGGREKPVSPRAWSDPAAVLLCWRLSHTRHLTHARIAARLESHGFRKVDRSTVSRILRDPGRLDASLQELVRSARLQRGVAVRLRRWCDEERPRLQGAERFRGRRGVRRRKRPIPFVFFGPGLSEPSDLAVGKIQPASVLGVTPTVTPAVTPVGVPQPGAVAPPVARPTTDDRWIYLARLDALEAQIRARGARRA